MKQARMKLLETVSMSCWNPRSPRMMFQWNVLDLARGTVLNVGSCDDPMRFRNRVLHLDYDDWSAYFEGVGAPFIQGDAHKLSDLFMPQRFDTVICGDLLEHVVDPMQVVKEACKVSSNAVAFTIWKEWRLPGPGAHISHVSLWEMVGEETSDKYYDRYEVEHPGCVTTRDIPHLGHVWQFTQEHIDKMLVAIEDQGFDIVLCEVVLEVVHEGHEAMNWIIYAQRPVKEWRGTDGKA